MSRYPENRLQYSSSDTTEEYSGDAEPENVKLYTHEDLERLMASDDEHQGEQKETIVESEEAIIDQQEESEEEDGSDEQEMTEEVGWDEDEEEEEEEEVEIKSSTSNRYHRSIVYSALTLFVVASVYIIAKRSPVLCW